MGPNRKSQVRHVLPAIRVPTLILHRSDDQAVSIAHSRYMAECVPGAKLVELPGIDHIPWVGDQDALLDEVEEFLTGTRPHATVDRVLATVLFTDIVGSTTLAAELGDRVGETFFRATTPWLAARSTAGAAGKSIRPAMGSSRASMDPPGQYGAPRRS